MFACWNLRGQAWVLLDSAYKLITNQITKLAANYKKKSETTSSHSNKESNLTTIKNLKLFSNNPNSLHQNLFQQSQIYLFMTNSCDVKWKTIMGFSISSWCAGFSGHKSSGVKEKPGI